LNLAAIRHRNTEEYIYPRGRNTLQVILHAAARDLDQVTLVYWPRYENDASKRCHVLMSLELRDHLRDHFNAVIPTEAISAYTRYGFLLKSGNETFWMGRNGFSADLSGDDFFEYLWPNPTDSFRTPDWAEKQVFYQIFPERFRNGDPALNPENTVPWGSAPDRENFMGGDLRGIIEKLDYIQDLGVTCLYLTPVFAAPSNHKYDTTDYYEIDPAFGTKEDLSNLVRGVHERGMKILLDGVFNHCGYYWPPFQDLVEHGESSRYRDWFFPRSFPVHERLENYDCVGHYKWMPKINLANPETRDYFIGVGKYWIEQFGIDGWRLDVADEMPVRFLEHFSDAMKETKSDVLLLGETWTDADRLLRADRLDTAMNYLFRDAAVDWLGKRQIRPSELDHRLNSMMALYPYEVVKRLYNPLDSHDTERFRVLCKNKRLHDLAILLQMTVPGCPAVFYGDEVGLEGKNDPGCRLAMEWNPEKQNRALLHRFQKLIAIRRSSESLTSGDFHSLLCDDENNVYIFARTCRDETTVVAVNAGDAVWNGSIRAEGEWNALLGETTTKSTEDGRISIVLAPYSGEIYQMKVKAAK